MRQALALLKAADFFLPEHRKILQAIARLAERNVPADLVPLVDELERSGELEAAGGAAYVASLVDGVPRMTNIEHYARIVREKALRRNLAHAANNIMQSALAGGDEAEEILRDAQSQLAQLHSTAGIPGRIAFVRYEEFLTRSGEAGDGWLIEDLLPVQSQTIWQGRPKVGKSHTLLQLAFDASCGEPVFGQFIVPRPIRCLYVELEEPEGITKSRLAAMIRARNGQGPDPGYLSFLSKGDLHRLRLRTPELLGKQCKDFCTAICDLSAEIVILVALRKLFVGDPNEPRDAENFNAALDELTQETRATIALANHNRKAPAETAEMRGLGSTMLTAQPDLVFDLHRKAGGLRQVTVEGRIESPTFYLLKQRVGEGEMIRIAPPPEDACQAKREAIRKRVAAGESTRAAALAEGVPASTAYRWMNSDMD